MNIYISHSGTYDYENELYGPLKGSDLAREYHFFLPHEPENLDVAAKLGLASAINVPIVCFYKSGTHPSGSLRFVTDKIFEYVDTSDLLDKLQAEL